MRVTGLEHKVRDGLGAMDWFATGATGHTHTRNRIRRRSLANTIEAHTDTDTSTT